MSKTIVCVCLVLSMILSFTACSSANNSSISLYDLNKAICDVADFKEMKYVSSQDDNAEELFSHISDMDYSKIDGFFINYAVNGTGNADEVACIMVKNKSDVAIAAESLRNHLKTRTGLYSSYDKSQLDKLSKAIVISNGNVVVLIVGDNVSKMESAFHAFFDN